MKTRIMGYDYGLCTHPQGPDSGIYAPEICCPDKLVVYGEPTTVNCSPICPHHKHNHEKE